MNSRKLNLTNSNLSQNLEGTYEISPVRPTYVDFVDVMLNKRIHCVAYSSNLPNELIHLQTSLFEIVSRIRPTIQPMNLFIFKCYSKLLEAKD